MKPDTDTDTNIDNKFSCEFLVFKLCKHIKRGICVYPKCCNFCPNKYNEKGKECELICSLYKLSKQK
jgi:hypothetical protein